MRRRVARSGKLDAAFSQRLYQIIRIQRYYKANRPARRRADANKAARRAQVNEQKEAIEKRKRDAQKRLNNGTSGNPWLQFRDRQYASGSFNMKDISRLYKQRKERTATALMIAVTWRTWRVSDLGEVRSV